MPINSEPQTRNQLYLGWEDLQRDAQALARRLIERGSWTGIVAVARGGLVPATIIARALDIRLIETVCVIGYSTDEYDPLQAEQITVIKPPPPLVGDGGGWIVVDDLADTGRTAATLRRLMPKAHFAAVYVKPLGRPMLDTYVAAVGQNTWIYFPWESAQMAPMTQSGDSAPPDGNIGY
jgi:xanthine phosphoribosyltransferase